MKDYDYPRPQQGAMTKQQLANMVFHATRLYDVLGDDDKIPAWVLSKVNTAEDRLRVASEYLRYKAQPSVHAYEGVHRAVASYGQGVGYGYPTIQSQVIEDKPYLCVSYEAEEKWMQPLRLATAAVAGPLIFAALNTAPRSALNTAAKLATAGISLWSGWTYMTASKAMVTGSR